MTPRRQPPRSAKSNAVAKISQSLKAQNDMTFRRPLTPAQLRQVYVQNLKNRGVIPHAPMELNREVLALVLNHKKEEKRLRREYANLEKRIAEFQKKTARVRDLVESANLFDQASAVMNVPNNNRRGFDKYDESRFWTKARGGTWVPQS